MNSTEAFMTGSLLIEKRQGMKKKKKNDYDELLAQSEIIEQDRNGIKVLRLPDGNFLKTFWYRHLVSSRRIYPERLRFSLNAGALKRRSVPTVTVIETVRIPHLQRTGVIYRPLAGRTLRQVAAAGEFNAELAGRLGQFVAMLHRKGIHFRSLHLGNVLLCPDGNFGLIDISDMIILPWPLLPDMRMRNFYHLFRYERDFEMLTCAGMREFLEQYINKQPAPRIRRRLHRAVNKRSAS